MAWLGLPVLLGSLAAFASRKVAAFGERTPRFVFVLDKPRIPDCRGTAIRAFAALSFRFSEKPLGSSKSGRVLVPPLGASPNPGLAHATRSTVPLQ